MHDLGVAPRKMRPKKPSGLTAASWPTISSTECGRMRSASGVRAGSAAACMLSACPNRVSCLRVATYVVLA